jgi:hypothetical protein
VENAGEAGFVQKKAICLGRPGHFATSVARRLGERKYLAQLTLQRANVASWPSGVGGWPRGLPGN